MSFVHQGDFQLPPTVVRPKDPRPPFPVRLGDSIVDFLNKPGGRDKLARTLQYVLKTFTLSLDPIHPEGSKNFYSVKLNGVANGLGAGRRFIRIGNLPQQLKDIAAAVQDPKQFVALFGSISKFSSLVFVFIDHSEWVSRCGVFKMNYEYWSWWAAFTWFLGALFGAVVNMYLWNLHRMRLQYLQAARQATTDPTKRDEMAKDAVNAEHAARAQLIDFARNFADLIMASNGVRKWESVPQMIFPVFGIASSLIGSWQAWPSIK